MGILIWSTVDNCLVEGEDDQSLKEQVKVAWPVEGGGSSFFFFFFFLLLTKGSLSYLSSPCFSKNVLQSGVGIVH